MARAKTSNPALDGMVDVPPPVDTVRLMVRTVPAQGDIPRHRAGFGPFGRQPVAVGATPEQADALRADPMLDVIEAEA